MLENQDIEVTLTFKEVALLLYMVDERIRKAQDEGIEETEASSVFRRALFDKLLAARETIKRRERA